MSHRRPSFSDAMLSGEQHAQLYHAQPAASAAASASAASAAAAASAAGHSVSAHYQAQDLDDLFLRPRSHTPSMQQAAARIAAVAHAHAQRKNQRKHSISMMAVDHGSATGTAAAATAGTATAAGAVASSPLLKPKPDTILLHSHSALVLNAPSLTAGLYASAAGAPSSRAMAAFNLSSSLSGLSLMQRDPVAGAASSSSPAVQLDAQGFMAQISPGQRDAAISAAGAAALAASAAAAVPAVTLSPRSRRRQLHAAPAGGYGSHAQAFYESLVSPVTGGSAVPAAATSAAATAALAGARHRFLIHQPLTTITAETVLASAADPQGRRNIPSGITFNGVNMSSSARSVLQQPTPPPPSWKAEGLSRSSSSSGILAFDPSSVSSSSAPPASAAPGVPTARPGTLKAVPLEAIRALPPSGSRALLALAHAPVTSYKLDLSSPATAAAAAVVAAAASGASGSFAATSSSHSNLPRLASSGESEQLAALRRQHASPLSPSSVGTGAGSSTAVLRPRKEPAIIVTATGQTMDAEAIARARKLLTWTLAQSKAGAMAEEQKSNAMVAPGSQSERRYTTDSNRRPAAASRTAAAAAALSEAPLRSARRAAAADPSDMPRVVLASAPDATGAKTARTAAAAPPAVVLGAVRTFGPRSSPPLHNNIRQQQKQQQSRKRASPPTALLSPLSQPAAVVPTISATADLSVAPSSPVESPAPLVAAVAAALSPDLSAAPVAAAVASPVTRATYDSSAVAAVSVTTQPATAHQQPQQSQLTALPSPAPISQAPPPAAIRAPPSSAALLFVSSPSVIDLSVAPAPVLAIPASAVADADSFFAALSVRRPPPEQQRYLGALHHSFAEMASANQTHVLTQSKSVTAQALDHTALERAELDRSARAQAAVLQAGLDGLERATAESKVQADAAWSLSASELARVYAQRSAALQTRLAQIAAQRQVRSQRLADELAAAREEAEVEALAQIARDERLEELRALEAKLSAHASRTQARWAHEWSAASAQREAAAAQAAREQLVKQAEIRAFMARQYEAKRAQAKAGVLWVRVIRGHQLGEEPMQQLGPAAVSRSSSSSDLLSASPSSAVSSASRLPKLSTCCLSFSLRFKAASLANESCYSSFFGRDTAPALHHEVFKMRVSNAALQTITIAIQAAQPKQVDMWERELRAALACTAQLSTAQQMAGETTQLTQLDQLAQAGLLRVHSALTATPSAMPIAAAAGAAAPSPMPAVPLLPTPSSHRRHVSFQSHARSASSSGGAGGGAGSSLHEFAAEMHSRSSAKPLGTIGEATPEASRAASKMSVHTPTDSPRSPSPHTPLQQQPKQQSEPVSPATPSSAVLVSFPAAASTSASRRGLRTHSRQISAGGSHDLLSGTPSGSPSTSSAAAPVLVGPVSVSSLSSSAISQLQSVAHLRPRSEVLSRVEEIGSVEIALASIRSAPHGRVAGEFALHAPLTDQKRKEREAKRAAEKRKQASKVAMLEENETSPAAAPPRRMIRHAAAVGPSAASSSGSLQTIRCGSVTVELWLLPLFDTSADTAAAAASASGVSPAPAPRTIRSHLRIGVSELSAEEQRRIDSQLEAEAEARAAATEMPVWNQEDGAGGE